MKTILAIAAAVAFFISMIVNGAMAAAYVAILAKANAIAPLLSTPLGKVRGYQVECLDSAPTDLTDGQAVSSLYVFVNSATPVHVGGSDVDATHGMPICTDSAECPAASLSVDVKAAKCLSSSGTVTATVLAGAI